MSSRSVKPITPEEAEKKREIPDFVIAVFNDLISAEYRNGAARVRQDQAIAAILGAAACPAGMTPNKLCTLGWLDIESIYAEHWDVAYDSPAYNETYEPSWTFSRRKR